MKSFRAIFFLIFLAFTSINVFSQQQAIMYQKAADLCEAAARKYDAKGCTASAAYCRKMKQWNLCMVNALAGRPNTCGIEPLPANAPRCDEAGIGGISNLSSNTLDPEQRYRQTQIELDNAKNAAMSAYQEAINNGRKGSGAVLDATLVGAQQLSDSKEQLVYTGVGLGVSLFMHLSEKNEEKTEADAKRINEERKRQLMIDTKSNFLKDLLNISKYSISDLNKNVRYAVLIITAKNLQASDQEIFFSIPTVVDPYSDSTYPSKESITSSLLKRIPGQSKVDKQSFVLYPVFNLEEFNNDFIKKIASGNVIGFRPGLIKFSELADNSKIESQVDFWGNPVKKDSTNLKHKQQVSKKQSDFWKQ